MRAPKLCTLGLVLAKKLFTLNPKLFTLNPKLYTLNHILNSTLQTLNLENRHEIVDLLPSGRCLDALLLGSEVGAKVKCTIGA